MFARTGLAIGMLALAGTIGSCPVGASQVITTFDPPGSTGTFANSINGTGTIAGWYTDSAGVGRGFVRASDGSIATFEVLKSRDTVGSGINCRLYCRILL